MSFAVPKTADFESYFSSDFPFGAGRSDVTPQDIQKALNQVAGGSYWNAALFSLAPLPAPPGYSGPAMNEATVAFLNAAAHYVYLNVKARGGLRAPAYKGGTTSAADGPVGSKTVGPVSVTYEWPESVKNDPMLFQFTLSPYGIIYLGMLTPKLVGAMALLPGENLPKGWGV